MVLFGVTTMTFYYKPILEALEIIAGCGFDCAEIWVDHAWDPKRGASLKDLRAKLAELNLQTTIHSSIMDINITSPNQGIRAESVRQTFQAIDLARALQSRLVVIHPGHKYSAREIDEEHWAYQVDSMEEILSYARQQGVLATIENMDSDKDIVSVKDWHDLNRLFKACGSKEKWVTLDVTHLRYTEKILDFITQAETNIAHVHLSDGTEKQMHLRIGQGELDLRQIVQALRDRNYQGVYSLECFIPNNDAKTMRAEFEQAKKLFAV